MKNIKLIKELNEKVREKDDFEKALDEAGIEFDLGNGDSTEMNYTNDGDDFDYNSDTQRDDELQKVADHWLEAGEEMSDDDLRDEIGNELEQLDYSPEDISSGIDTVMDMLDRGDDQYSEPDVDERQEHEDFEQADEYFGGGDEYM